MTMTFTLFQCLDTVSDLRYPRGVRHKTSTILKMIVLGFACRLVAVEHIVNYFRPIWNVVGPELGSDRIQPPDPTTVRRILESVNRDELEKAFRCWVGDLVKGDKLTASVDGKTLCNSGCQKVLNVFAHEIKLTLAQEDIKDGEGESTTLRRSLAKLFSDYPGLSILTGDAAYSGRDLCKAIKDAGRDYIVQAKGNQGSIHKQIKEWFEEDIQKRSPDAVSIKKNPRRTIFVNSG